LYDGGTARCGICCGRCGRSNQKAGPEKRRTKECHAFKEKISGEEAFGQKGNKEIEQKEGERALVDRFLCRVSIYVWIVTCLLACLPQEKKKATTDLTCAPRKSIEERDKA
jgi:hypothetical protein